jgi:Skp family chaperone for outer membrane proteins
MARHHRSKERETVKQPLILAALVALGFSFIHSAAWGQGARPAGPAPQVAAVDIVTVFEKYTAFTERKAQWDSERERIEAEMQSLQSQLQAMAAHAKDFKPGTPEFTKLEQEYAVAEAEAKSKMSVKQREHFLRQGKMFYQTYSEVVEEIKIFAERNGILMVLRYNGTAVDQENAQELMAEMGEEVVYYNKQIDISDHIVAQLNSRRPARGPAAPQAAAPPTGPRAAAAPPAPGAPRPR